MTTFSWLRFINLKFPISLSNSINWTDAFNSIPINRTISYKLIRCNFATARSFHVSIPHHAAEICEKLLQFHAELCALKALPLFVEWSFHFAINWSCQWVLQSCKQLRLLKRCHGLIPPSRLSLSLSLSRLFFFVRNILISFSTFSDFPYARWGRKEKKKGARSKRNDWKFYRGLEEVSE